jgi:hypothetical protein
MFPKTWEEIICSNQPNQTITLVRCLSPTSLQARHDAHLCQHRLRFLVPPHLLCLFSPDIPEPRHSCLLATTTLPMPYIFMPCHTIPLTPSPLHLGCDDASSLLRHQPRFLTHPVFSSSLLSIPQPCHRCAEPSIACTPC